MATENKISDEDVEMVAGVLWRETCRDLAPTNPVIDRPTQECYSDAKAVLERLAGRLLPPGGEVETQYGCRTVDELQGKRVARYVSQETAWAAVEHHRRIYATRGTYGGRAELVHRQVHTDPWEVVSDNSEVPDVS